MNKKQKERMKADLMNLSSPFQLTIITKHHCFSFISFMIGEFREDLKELFTDDEKFLEVKEELKMLMLNRTLNRCPLPNACDNYDYCEEINCSLKEEVKK